MATSYLFIDSRIEDLDVLLDGLAADTTLVRLDPLRDGITQIAEALEGESGLGSIQIVSHGSPGSLVLGDTTLSDGNVGAYAADLAAIGRALAESGDILLWGCDVAAGEAGAAFIGALAEFTGADVAASTDATGFAGRGGDWDLEAVAGSVESAPFVSPEAQAQYTHVLGGDPPVLTVTGAIDTAISADGLVMAHFSSNDNARGIALQADGKLVVAGDGYNDGFGQDFLVARFNADGTLDTGFGTGGRTFTDFGFTHETVAGVGLQADGKAVVAGFGQGQLSGTNDFQLARYDASGNLDAGFGTGGMVATDLDGQHDYANGILVQADDKILIVGASLNDLALMRYNADGSDDAGFGSNGRVFQNAPGALSSTAFAAAEQADGKIVVAGAANDGFGLNVLVSRFNDNGTLDTGFGSNGFFTVDFGLVGYDDLASAVAIQDDGKILVAGKVVDFNTGTYDMLLVRFNANGSLDQSFGESGRVQTGFGSFDTGFSNEEARSITLQADGRIVVVGDRQGDVAVVRYNSNGSLDEGFGDGGSVFVDFGLYDSGVGAVLRPDGRIVVAATATAAGPEGLDFGLAWIGPEYLADQRVNTGDAFSLQVPADYFTDPEGDALTYSALANGGPLPGWLAFDAATRTLSIVAHEYTGQIAITITASDGTGSASDEFLLTINSSPAVANFIPDQGATEDAAFNFTFAADAFSDPEAFDELTFTATLADESALPAWLTFDAATRTFTGTPLNENVGTISVTVTASDGLLSASDTFDITVANTNDAPILTPAGTPDVTFDGDGLLVVPVDGATAVTNYSNTLVLQADGSILLMGSAGNQAAVIRIDGDGVADAGFAGDGVANAAGIDPAAMAVQADGKLLVVGQVQTETGTDISIARFNADGTLDTSFGGDGTVSLGIIPGQVVDNGGVPEITPGSDDWAGSIDVGADGTIVVTGMSMDPSNFPWTNVVAARFNADGSPDPSFNGSGAMVSSLAFQFGDVTGTLVQADNKVVAVGHVSDFGTSDIVVGRLTADGQTESGFGNFNGFMVIDLLGAQEHAYDVAQQADGKLLVAGDSDTNGSADFFIVRLDGSFGDIDVDFGGGGGVVTTQFGAGTSDSARSIAIQADGKIVVAGYTSDGSDTDFAIARYHANGTLDTSFSGDGRMVIDFGASDAANSVAIDANGRIVVSGTSGGDFAVARIAGDGLASTSVVNAGSAYSLTIAPNLFTDPDGDAMTYSVALADGSPLPSWLTYDAGTQTLSGTPGGSDVGTIDVRISASDGTASGSEVFSLKVNGAPTVDNPIADQQTDEDAFFQFTFAADTFGDPNDGEALTLSATLGDGSALPGWLTFDAASRLFYGTPFNEQVGTLQVRVTASDGALSVSDTFALEVINTNDVPVLASLISGQIFSQTGFGSLGAAIGSPLAFQFESGTFIDFDAGDTLAYSATLSGGGALPAWLTFDPVTRTFSGTPGESDAGSFEVRVTADDGEATADDVFSIAVGHAPVLAVPIPDQAAVEDELFTYELDFGTFTDADPGDVLSYQATLADGSQLPDWLSFDQGSLTFTALPENQQVGTYEVRVTASDSILSASDTFTLTVANVNDVPFVRGAGNLDPAFAGDGTAVSTLAPGSHMASAVAATPDGKTVVVGTVQVGDEADIAVARYNADGSLDSNFGGGDGFVLLDIGNGSYDQAFAVAVQADGRIVLTGATSDLFDGNMVTVRLTTSGEYDTTFSGDGIVTADLHQNGTAGRSIAVQADGHILVGAQVGYDTLGAVRYNANGSLDTSFSGDGVFTLQIPAEVPDVLADLENLALGSDGSILLAGTVYDQINDIAFVNLVKLTSAGALDTSFSGDGQLETTLQPGQVAMTQRAVLDSGGGILVVETDIDGTSVARYTEDGVLDVSFGNLGVAEVDFGLPVIASSVALQSDGAILVIGTAALGSSSTEVVVHRLAANGATDTTFGDGGTARFAFGDEAGSLAAGISIQPDGAVVVVGGSGQPDFGSFSLTDAAFGVARLAPGGTPDLAATEDQPFSVTIGESIFADVDVGDTLTLTATLLGGGALPAWLSFDSGTRTFSGTPGNADVGSFSVSITATDIEGASVSDVLVLTVANVNDAPFVSAPIPDKSAAEGNAFILNIPRATFTDIDPGAVLSFSATLADGSALPDWLDLLSGSRTLLGTPTQDDVGTLDIRITASDGTATASDVFTLVVADTNFAPFAIQTVGHQQATEDAPFSFQFNAGLFTDPDGDALTYTATRADGSALPGWLSLDSATRTFSGTPQGGDDGILDIRLVANDGDKTGVAGFTLVVAGVNDAPVVAVPLPDREANAGTPFVFEIDAGAFDDADDTTLFYSATLADGSALPGWLAFDGATRTFSGTPSSADSGVIDVRVTVSDGNGGSVDDTFSISIGDNLVAGTGGNDELTGTASNDLIQGGAGNDFMQGGAGDDTYEVDSPWDIVFELPGQGTDTVLASITYALGADVENLTLTGSASIGATGNDDANVLTGNAGNNVLAGGLGNDTYVLGGGVDTLVEAAGAGTDTVMADRSFTLALNFENLTLTGSGALNGTGNAAANVLTGNAGDNVLTGGDGNDTLSGGDGNDTLVGGNGNDVMEGGLGDDTFVFGTGDTLVEGSGGGTDTVQSAVTFSLAVTGREHIENLTLTGAAAISGTGNALDNVLTGNAAANILDGGAGNDILDGGAGSDSLRGGSGDDTYFFGAGDTIVEAADGGTDHVFSGVTAVLALNVENLTLTGTAVLNGTGNAGNNVITGNAAANVLGGGAGNDTLMGGGGNDTLSGGDGVDLLFGNAGNDVLDGGAGADTLTGGAGSDTYVVSESGDNLIENADEGTDLVQSALSWTLGANIENLTLTGTGIVNGFGNALDNTLIGNAAVNTLTGAAGNDTLDGGAGNDTLLGGDGNDTLVGGLGNDNLNGGEGDDLYVIGLGTDNLTDSGGTDTVQSSITFTLASGFENLTLTGAGAIAGTGNGLDNVLTGNGAANILTGGAGNDTFNGGAGVDRLIGGLGDDTFIFGAGDIVVENAGEGTDTMLSAVAATLALNVENLFLTGTGAIAGTGNALDNVITGNMGNNALNGAAGNDTLAGGAGNDTLTGGLGEDVFRFDTAPTATNRDAITDFVHGTDSIELDSTIYTGLTAGALGAGTFRSGAGITTAADADDRIVYNTTTGALFYDADGSGATAAIQFATLNTRPAIDATDVSIV